MKHLEQIPLLLSHVSEGKRQELEAYIHELCKNDGKETGTQFGIDDEFLGFMDDYFYLSKIIKGHIIDFNPESLIRIVKKQHNYIIVDVGCYCALQHVFFEPCIKYIGIDSYPQGWQPKFFHDNCEFLKGTFKQVVEDGQLKISENMIGIANMSLLYGGDSGDLGLFNTLFKRKWIF